MLTATAIGWPGFETSGRSADGLDGGFWIPRPEPIGAPEAVDYLQSVGVQTVIVHGNRLRTFQFHRLLDG